MNPHQWSLAKQSSLKVANDGQKVPKQAEAKRDNQQYDNNHSDKTSLNPKYSIIV